MSSEDLNIWETYKRGVKTPRKNPLAPTPTSGHSRGTGVSDPDKLVANSSMRTNAASAKLLPTTRAKSQLTVSDEQKSFTSTPLERRREKKFRQGDIKIDAKLDLHGMTQVEAFAALAKFIHGKVKAGNRTLLIVTGKGRKGQGVLRTQLPDWLEQLSEGQMILAIRPAALAHGGSGAFYVILRSKK